MTRSAASDARADAMADLYRAGQTLEQIGVLYGVSAERVRQVIKISHGLNGSNAGAHFLTRQKKQAKLRDKVVQAADRCGCTLEQWQEMHRVGAAMRAVGASNTQTPFGAYRTQMFNSAKRGIAWEISLWDWWQVWDRSGKWSQRGRGSGYVMSRHGDGGPYAVGNVCIKTNSENTAERHRIQAALRLKEAA